MNVILGLALAILAPILMKIASFEVWKTALVGILTIGSAVYFVKERHHRSSSFNRLTLLLLDAILLLGWAKGIKAPGVIPLAFAALSTIPLDISYTKSKVLSLPFWIFTGWAVGEIFAAKYGPWGYLTSLVVLLIAWRDLNGKIQKAQ